MKKTKYTLSYKTLWQFLVPYIIVLCIPLLIGTIAYYVSYSTLLKQAEGSSLSMLKQCQQIFDNNLLTIDRLMENQLNSTLINQFASIGNPYDSQQIGKVIDLNIQVSDIPNGNNMYFKNYLLFTQSKMSISSENNCSLVAFYNRVFRLQDQTYSDFYNMISNQYYYRKFLPIQNAIYKNENIRALVCLYSIGQLKQQNGAILVFIDEKNIDSVFSIVTQSSNTQLVIYDSDGVALYQIGGSLPASDVYLHLNIKNENNTIFRSSINGMQVYVANVESAYNGWHYVFIQPTKSISTKVYGIFTFSLWLSFFIFIVGVIVAAFMAFRSTRTMTTLMKLLEGGLPIDKSLKVGPFAVLRGALVKLMEDKNTLMRLTSEQATLVHASFMEKLLRGSYISINDMTDAIQRMNISSTDSTYCVAVFYLLGYNDTVNDEILSELNGRRTLLIEYIKLKFAGNAYAHNISTNSIAVLFSFKMQKEKDCRIQLKQRLDEFCSLIPKSIQNNMFITLGRMYSGLENASRSFGDAQSLIYSRRHNNTSMIIWYDENVVELGSFFYPTEIENRLISVVRTGSHDETLELLNIIYQENFVLRDIPSIMLGIFINDMISTAIKLLSQNLISRSSIQIVWDMLNQKQEDAVSSYHNIIKPVFLKICSLIYEQKDKRINTLTKDIIEYIYTNYRNTQLSLSLLAETFKLSEVYMSQFFKDQIGENFSSFLENLRINEAKSLLLNTDMQIQEIALQVGYQSSNSFCRAFKRVTQTNAGDFRELQQCRHA